MPAAPHVGAGVVDATADTVVPTVSTAQARSGFTVRSIAVAQSSFVGGGGGMVTQIPKVPFPLFPYSQTLSR